MAKQLSAEDFNSVDFNQEWLCLHQSGNDPIKEKNILTELNQFRIDRSWLQIELPHRSNTNLGAKIESNEPFKWWYRKQFDWIPPAESTIKQRICIDFDLADDYHQSHPLKNIQATIWLNGTQIFQGFLLKREDSIELSPKYLRRTDGPKDTTVHSNILVICCVNTPLCVDMFLLIYGKVICASGEVKVDEKTASLDKKHDDLFDYTVNMDDADGRITVNFNPRRKSKSKPSPTPSISSRKSLTPSVVIDPVLSRKNSADHADTDLLIPRLAIVILIVGTRGDVQPFIALGQTLRAAGHRVRLATHETFRSFVRGNGLEFYPLAGDPADLMSFMVKNAGIIPSMSSIIEGDVAKKRRALTDILASTWQACIQPDDETNLPFTAEAIIANPPSFGHIHCAEKLQIPLHIMFTMPWTPTRAFAHPLANIDSSIGPTETINFYSYDVIEMLTWTGMRDIVNNFRKKTLELSTLHTRQAIHALIDEQVPHTYCWSPTLVTKPHDWGEHIDVSGFFFLDLGTTFTNPPADLLHFLSLDRDKSQDRKSATNSPPIYIGFGSITGHDSRRILTVVVNALQETGYRALLSGLASDSDELPTNIFKIGNVPHDWLFQHVSAVCHHGGAGTTAAGLRAGKPTIIVPFFGDQFFWGTVIEKSGAGPAPLPGKSITTDQLAEAFRFVHKTSTRKAAERIRDAILEEDGCQAAVHAFHANLPLTRMHSDLEPTFAACFRVEKYNLQISRPVAQVLVVAGLLEESQLERHMTREWQFMYDDRNHLPAQGIIEHSQKAFTCMFTDTAADLKRVANNSDPSTKTLESAGTIAKGVGLGIGHFSIGCLSLYGEMTDTLDYVVQLYDPYSDPQRRRPRPRVTDFESGAKAAGQALWNGWKEGFTGIVTQPRKGYEKHDALGAAAGAFIAAVNMVVKPSVGTLSSITWLGRGTYASVAKAVKTYQNEGRRISPNLFDSTPTASSEHPTETDDHKSMTPIVKKAASVSGFHPNVCFHIISEFEKIMAEHEQKRVSPSSKKKNMLGEFLSEGKDAIQALRAHKRTASS